MSEEGCVFLRIWLVSVTENKRQKNLRDNELDLYDIMSNFRFHTNYHVPFYMYVNKTIFIYRGCSSGGRPQAV